MLRFLSALVPCFACLLAACGEKDFTQHADEATMRRITRPDALNYLVEIAAAHHEIDAVQGDPEDYATMCQYTEQGIIGASGEHEPFNRWLYTAKIGGVERGGEFDGNLVARVYLQAGVPANFSILGGAFKVSGRSSEGPLTTCFAYVRRVKAPATEITDELTNIISALRVLGARRL
jgi:hypothetical protein